MSVLERYAWKGEVAAKSNSKRKLRTQTTLAHRETVGHTGRVREFPGRAQLGALLQTRESLKLVLHLLSHCSWSFLKRSASKEKSVRKVRNLLITQS